MKIRLASAPVSWGIFEFEGIEPRYPWSQVLDEIAGTGYVGTELGPFGYLPTSPKQLYNELESRGLRLLSAFVPVNLVNPTTHEDGLQTALTVGRLLANLGARHLVLADDNASVSELVQQAGQRKGSKLSAAQWKNYGAGVELIRKGLLEELGLETVFHHHCAGYVETPEETQALLEHSSVNLCLDTGHWHYGGGDAVECVKRFKDRVTYLHFKDCSPEIAARCRAEKLDYFAAVKAGLFCPLGEGEVDFPKLLEALQDFDGWAVVEQDVLVDDLDAPRRFSQQNREYLKGLGL